MTQLEKAIAIATEAHTGQKDRAGMPYVLHPLHVMAAVETNDEKIVAILHDVVEDTDWTFERLRLAGFSADIIAAIDAVTKRQGESYEDFVIRSAMNPISRKVKIADLEHNMDIRRLETFTERDVERLRKYLKAWRFLTSAAVNRAVS